MSHRDFDGEAARIGRDGFFTLGLTLVLVIASLCLLLLPALWWIYRTAKECPDQAPDRLSCLVFGKKLRKGAPDEEYRQRLRKAVELMRADPQRITFLLGGRRGKGLSEARVGFEHIQELNPPTGARIILEEDSRDTLENLRNARQDLSVLEEDTVVLVSSRYHLARCSRIATNLGLHHRLCAADPNFQVDLKMGFRLLLEAFYCTWFYTGMVWARLTRNQRMWSRIS